MNVSLSNNLNGSGTALVLDGNVDVTDADLEQLGGFGDQLRRKITTVVLSRTNIQGSGIKHLNALPNLTRLFLNGSSITDSAPFDELPRSLEVLNLDNTSVGDRGVSRLCGMPSLRVLRLEGTEVTDRGLFALLKLRSLSEIYLERTATSWMARRRLENDIKLNAAGYSQIVRYAKGYTTCVLSLVTLRARTAQHGFNYGAQFLP
jgi:Leucine-rich repeat (LRR) protein